MGVVSLADKRIGVLMGGVSSERAISLKSGEAVMASLKRCGIMASAIDVNSDVPFALRSAGIDTAFIALHGRYGEDGIIQGVLEMMRIPYTGSGLLASALGMNKLLSRQVFIACGIPTPPFILLNREEAASFPDRVLPFDYPVVVKPIAQGSSVGVSIANTPTAVTAALTEAFRWDAQVLVEPFIVGTEVHVGILGCEALGAIEIRSKRAFYDYQAKYEKGMSDHIFPAPLPPDVYQAVLAWGVKAHAALGCSGYSRVDLLLDRAYTPYVLEINTLPGMTETSLLPEMARGVNISFDQLVTRILERASLHT